MNGTFICSHCGGEHPMESHIIFHGQDLCLSCYESETAACERCGERIWTEDDCSDANHVLCRDCVDSCYDRRADCGCLVAHGDMLYLPDDEDDDDGCCETCYERHAHSNAIQHYYKPEPIFCGSGSRYLGVELEIDGGGEVLYE